MDTLIRTFFHRYEQTFNAALAGGMGMDEVATLYAAEFIAASPRGVKAGRNDDGFKQSMAQGYEHYRAIGTKGMRVRDVRVIPMDALHYMAHVAWTATYARADRPDVSVDFDVYYLVQLLNGEPKVFGWVAGDEKALLKERGII